MKDLRIVVVSWNVEKLLGKCLRTLAHACDGLEWDAVVVDNASSDESVNVAKTIADQSMGRIRVIANTDNRGFAKACNQGMDGSDSRYVLLLNPDAECAALSLTRFVRIADQRPHAGILGPRITYPDGTYQPSVRRFPTVWDQAGILLKLHHLFLGARVFSRYFADDLDREREQRVDQVMGACFLIRRGVIDRIGGLDERYFIWFEEVDYCRMAVKNGWDVLYVPSVSVIHHGGQSFGQVFSLKKQTMFDESLLKYFRKWHPGWRTALLACLDPVSRGLAWIVDRVKRPQHEWILWFFGILCFETISLSTVYWPVPRTAATVMIGVLMLLVSRRRPDIGLAAVLLELMIGSKGALLKLPHGWEVDGGTSIRVILMGAFLMGWFANSVSYWFEHRKELMSVARDTIRDRKPWIALLILAMWGAVRGAWLGNPFLLEDANAWLFLVLLIPVIGLASRYRESLINHAAQAAIAALVWLPIKVLGLLYIFSHGLNPLSRAMYLWVRRTGVGEVTLVTANLFRIFLQSQVYALFAVLFAGASAFAKNRHAQSMLIWIVFIGSSASLLISLSRSMWIGLFCGAAALIVMAARHAGTSAIRSAAKIAVGAIAGLLCIAAVVAFPYPRVEMGSLAALFGSRGSTTDAAAESRWNLLPVLLAKIQQAPILGSGFGATVAYVTKDPRILAANPNGVYVTYAFEWGWLEHWVKFGFLGIPVMAWLVMNLIRRAWKTDAAWWIRAGFVSSLIGLAALHVFTPYLNHPLGFGFLLATEAFIIASDKKEKT